MLCLLISALLALRSCTGMNGTTFNKKVQCAWVVFCNKLPWFVSELPEEDISNVLGGPS
jgi:hypothetical protein